MKGESCMASISFEGIGEVVATFKAKSGLAAGQVVKVTGAGEMGACAAGERFCGLALSVDEGLAAVQVKGFATLPCTGVLSAGWSRLSANGSGGVKADAANGTEYLVVGTDLLAGTATVLL